MMDDNYIFKRAFIISILEIHPAIVYGMVVADLLLFLAEIYTFGLSYFLTILIAICFGVFTVYMQMMTCGDCFAVAMGKGIIVAIIILVPLPLLAIMYLSLYVDKRKKNGVDENKKQR